MANYAWRNGDLRIEPILLSRTIAACGPAAMSQALSAWAEVARFIEAAGTNPVFGIPGDD